MTHESQSEQRQRLVAASASDRAEPSTGTQDGVADAPGDPARGITTGASVLALDGWLEFNRLKWNVQPLRLTYSGGDVDQQNQPKLEAVVYCDKRGQIVHPPRNPYLPVRFQPTPTTFQHRYEHQWLRLSDRLAAETKRRGLQNTMNLAPNVVDVRQWQWAGFQAGVHYTMVIVLPFASDQMDRELGRTYRKAEQAGFRSDRTTNWRDVMSCLRETEVRQRFSLEVSATDLQRAADLLGDDHFRAYVCYAPNGEPASTSIVLHQPGTPAIGWIGGSRTAYLPASPSQFLEFFIMADLTQHGASAYDLAGANMRSIAAAKSNWGGRLQPYYTIEGYNSRKLARWTVNWWTYLKRRPVR